MYWFFSLIYLTVVFFLPIKRFWLNIFIFYSIFLIFSLYFDFRYLVAYKNSDYWWDYELGRIFNLTFWASCDGRWNKHKTKVLIPGKIFLKRLWITNKFRRNPKHVLKRALVHFPHFFMILNGFPINSNLQLRSSNKSQ